MFHRLLTCWGDQQSQRVLNLSFKVDIKLYSPSHIYESNILNISGLKNYVPVLTKGLEWVIRLIKVKSVYESERTIQLRGRHI